MRMIPKRIRELVWRKKRVASLVVAILVVSSVGIGGVWISHRSETKTNDLESILETLDLPQMAPYLASSGVFAGEANGDMFGYSVANAGDFNADGINDVVVGAPHAGYSDRGKVYIFFGGDGDPSVPDVTITTIAGDNDNEDFGWSVAGGGDFDGNAGDEVIVGDPRYDNGNDEDAGRVYIFTYDDQTSAMALSNAIYDGLIGEGAYDLLGYSVDIGGDFGNDGNADAIVGAPGFDSAHSGATTSDQGRAYFVLGGGSDIVKPVWAESGQSDASFGLSVSYVGKAYDGLYQDDVVIGAPDYDEGGSSLTGRAYLFWGRTITGNYLEAPYDSIEITGESDGDRFGESVSYAGDVDGDKDDLIVGAPGVTSDTGKAYIFEGYVDSNIDLGNDDADVELTGTATGDKFGISVSTAGDYNDDNYDDVIVGAYLEDAIAYYGTDAGKAHIFYGGSSMDDKVDVTMVGDTSSSDRYKFGFSVSNAGDFDNDGYDDVVVGAPYSSSSKGYAHLYHFHDHFTSAGVSSIFGNEQRGYSVASGNINGDSYSDVIVGSPYYSDISNNNMGKVLVFKGSSTGLVSSPLLMELSEGDSSDLFGWSVASGNFNGDMFDDVIVGAPGYDSNKGRAYIFYGGSSPDSTVDLTMTGQTTEKFGYSVAVAETHANPQVSYDDAIVGAPDFDDGVQNPDSGKIYVFEGERSMDNTADKTVVGYSQGDQFGFSVANAGDVDAAAGSAEDVIVGAPYADGGLYTDRGKAYIFFGTANGMDTDPDIAFGGQFSYDHLGWSVSSAGDYNNDGYCDLIVGAPGYDDGGDSNVGRAYIYWGDDLQEMDAYVDRVLDGEGAGDEFGYSVSAAGDVDNDGYDDVVVGAHNNDAGGSNAGRAYIFYGTSGVLTYAKEDIHMTGQAAGEQLGFSVAGAGDVNNDNYDDVVTGGPYWDSDRGRIKVWGDPS